MTDVAPERSRRRQATRHIWSGLLGLVGVLFVGGCGDSGGPPHRDKAWQRFIIERGATPRLAILFGGDRDDPAEQMPLGAQIQRTRGGEIKITLRIRQTTQRSSDAVLSTFCVQLDDVSPGHPRKVIDGATGRERKAIDLTDYRARRFVGRRGRLITARCPPIPTRDGN